MSERGMSEHGAQFTLGTIHTEADRDAVHIAVAPVTAVVMLAPGQDIGFEPESTERVLPCDKPVGIVDPFLRTSVRPGQRFWMFLYPNTITGLHHEWTHPAFQTQPIAVENKETARQWLLNFANEWSMDFSSMVEAAIHQGYITAGVDLHSVSELCGQDQEFWRQMEIYTSEKFGQSHRAATTFTCSC